MTGRCAMAEPPGLPRRSGPGSSLRTRAARGTVINTGFSVTLGLLTLLRGFVLAAFLTPADYGVWGVLTVSLGALLFFKAAGVGDRFVAQDGPDLELAFQRAFTAELALTGACVALMAVAVPLLILVYDLPALLWPSMVIAVTLLVSVLQAPQWVFYRRMDFLAQRLLQAVDPVIGFVVAVVLAVAGAGYWAFVGGMAAGTCAASAVAVWRSPFALRLRWDPELLREYRAFSGPLLLAGAAGAAMAFGAALAAKLHLGVAAVGAIALAYNVVSFTDSVDQLITGTLYPAICAVRDRTDVLYESLVKSNRLTLMWGVPFGVGVTLFGADLVHLVIGDRWRSAILLLQVCGVTAAINHVGFNWTAYFRAVGRTRPIAIVTVAAALVLLGLGIPLMLVLGLKGFAIGIAGQAAVALVLRALYLGRLFAGFSFLRHAARAFIPTLPATAVVLVVRWAAPGHRGLLRALAELAVYAIVTVGFTWWAERPLLREALGSLLGRPLAVRSA